MTLRFELEVAGPRFGCDTMQHMTLESKIQLTTRRCFVKAVSKLKDSCLKFLFQGDSSCQTLIPKIKLEPHEVDQFLNFSPKEGELIFCLSHTFRAKGNGAAE
jgi:hypothetical protein